MNVLMEKESLPIALNASEKRKIIALLCSVLMFSVMNATMFMIAVPDIAAYFSLLPSQVSWVVTGYIIIYSVGALMYGKLADLFPFKTLLTIGLCLFFAGSLIGFWAPNYMIVIIARIIQAAGAASIPSLVFIAPSRYFPDEQGRILGIASSTMAFASGIGPVLGGFISGSFHWQYLFLVSSFVVITIPFFRMWLPKEEQREGTVDIQGALWMALGVASLIFFITTFQWLFLPISLLFFGLFVWRIFHTDEPFIRPDLFTNVAFRTMIMTSFLGMFTMMSMMFILPILLRDIYHLNTISIGFVLFPGAMCAAIIGQMAGRLTDRVGSEKTLYLALGLMLLGFFLISIFIGSAVWIISAVLIFGFIAFPFFQTATANFISKSLSDRQLGTGMGIYTLCNFMSGAFGGAIIGKILDHTVIDWTINPFAQAVGNASIYSNIYVGMMLLTLISGAIFYLVVVRRAQKTSNS
jgi:DHA2 family metal-tetracycline-proton antiporter-like MFS transporter